MMSKQLFVFLSILIGTILNCAYAADSNCTFPQHIDITGPQGTHIVHVEAGAQSDFTVIKTSDTSFDVIDNKQCMGHGVNFFRLEVASDDKRYNAAGVYADNSEGHMIGIEGHSSNGFYLKDIKQLSMHNFQFIYDMR